LNSLGKEKKRRKGEDQLNSLSRPSPKPSPSLPLFLSPARGPAPLSPQPRLPPLFPRVGRTPAHFFSLARASAPPRSPPSPSGDLDPRVSAISHLPFFLFPSSVSPGAQRTPRSSATPPAPGPRARVPQPPYKARRLPRVFPLAASVLRRPETLAEQRRRRAGPSLAAAATQAPGAHPGGVRNTPVPFLPLSRSSRSRASSPASPSRAPPSPGRYGQHLSPLLPQLGFPCPPLSPRPGLVSNGGRNR
jgi:hypothetical protein